MARWYAPPVPRSRSSSPPVLVAAAGTAVLALVTAAIYTVLWAVDFVGVPGALAPWTLFGLPAAADTVGGLGEVTIAVLGIALTVVAIIVELAANRYTARVTELFLRDPINGLVLGWFAVTAALVIATSMSLYGPVYPTRMVQVVTSAMIVSMLAILPYFVYVFDFLTPRSVIRRIEERAEDGLAQGAARPTDATRREVAQSVEQLGEIALSSVQKKDKAIAIGALAALADIAQAAIARCDAMPAAWFEAGTLAPTDQDLVSFHPDIIARVTRRRTWVEMKVLRQYQAVFGETLTHLQDVGHIVAIQTRQLALATHRAGHDHGTRLCLDFVHTYLRVAINGRDVRSAYNVFNEYRALAEDLLAAGADELVREIGERFRFYGQLAFARQLPFILETAAYDLCTLLEAARAADAPSHDALLETFLQLDREPDGGRHQEASLRGVRKAQIKLATFYLARGEDALARRIFDDMRHEARDRLASIRAELEEIDEPEFWEVSDRGNNFDWLPPARRALLPTFFAWFDEATA